MLLLIMSFVVFGIGLLFLAIRAIDDFLSRQRGPLGIADIARNITTYGSMRRCKIWLRIAVACFVASFVLFILGCVV